MMSILIPCRKEPKILKMTELTEKEFPDAQIIVANDRDGRGKGWALREALSQATGDPICFIDGDLDIHPKMIHRLLPFLTDYDIVVGKKQVRGFLRRRIMTHLSRLYTRIFFGLIYDTQTGVKVFHRYAIPEWKCNSYAFDLEILTKAKNSGMTIIEVPIEANINRQISLKSVWRYFLETVRILTHHEYR